MVKNLQLLRAFAALCVVFHHYNFLNFHSGAFGVDIFFVISGFIISFTVEKKSTHFFLKRLIRIIPMYYLATLFVIMIWFINPAVFKTTFVNASAVIKSFLFIPYPGGPILKLGYTLFYEMYFYFIVACFLKFAKDAVRALLFTAVFILFICIVNYTFFKQIPIADFYGGSVVFEFIYGIVLYFLYRNLKNEIPEQFFYYGLALCIVSIIFMVYVGYPEIPIHYRGILFGIPAFFVCSFFVVSECRFNTTSVIYKYFYKLGNASYTMYLIHPFVIYGVLRIIHPLLNSDNIILTIIEFLISIALVCLMSTLIYNKIELRIQRLLKHKVFGQSLSAS